MNDTQPINKNEGKMDRSVAFRGTFSFTHRAPCPDETHIPCFLPTLELLHYAIYGQSNKSSSRLQHDS